jgi:plasmid maintenance system killer protein
MRPVLLRTWICRGSGFTPLKGELKGFYAVTVRANWRVIFRFDEGGANDVDYVDYH